MDLPPDESSLPLRNQVALVTGGGRGIGRAIAGTLASAGAAVAVLSRSAAELDETVRSIETKSGRALSVTADIADPEAVSNAIHKIEESLGPVNVLVNNAGVVKPLAPLWESDVQEWWRGMEVNVLGPFLACKFVLPGMINRRRGRIINISSGGGATAMPFFSSYVCSKTALIRLSECLALETKACGISVFSISPGTVRTAMSEYSVNSPEGKRWLPWFRRFFDEQVTVPVDVPAKLVLELASGKADALSGRFISIYDDLDELVQQAQQVEKENLYALKVGKLAGAKPNPVLASILAEARNAGELARQRTGDS